MAVRVAIESIVLVALMRILKVQSTLNYIGMRMTIGPPFVVIVGCRKMMTIAAVVVSLVGSCMRFVRYDVKN